MQNRQIFAAFAASGMLAVASCAPPQKVPVDLAEAQCMQTVLNGPNGAVTVGIGTGNGGWDDDWGWGGGWGGGAGFAVTTTLPPNQSPAEAYNACVLRRSGLPPVTPFAKRPELAG